MAVWGWSAWLRPSAWQQRKATLMRQDAAAGDPLGWLAHAPVRAHCRPARKRSALSPDCCSGPRPPELTRPPSAWRGPGPPCPGIWPTPQRPSWPPASCDALQGSRSGHPLCRALPRRKRRVGSRMVKPLSTQVGIVQVQAALHVRQRRARVRRYLWSGSTHKTHPPRPPLAISREISPLPPHRPPAPLE